MGGTPKGFAAGSVTWYQTRELTFAVRPSARIPAPHFSHPTKCMRAADQIQYELFFQVSETLRGRHSLTTAAVPLRPSPALIFFLEALSLRPPLCRAHQMELPPPRKAHEEGRGRGGHPSPFPRFSEMVPAGQDRELGGLSGTERGTGHKGNMHIYNCTAGKSLLGIFTGSGWGEFRTWRGRAGHCGVRSMQGWAEEKQGIRVQFSGHKVSTWAEQTLQW